MSQALALAIRGRGLVEPNPMVGAVIVRDGEVVGRGFHERYGGPHAEVNALADCRANGVDPAGLTMHVTLEPCSHHGKTPPCARALVEAGLGRVVVAMADPFPEVAGRGLALLRDAGIGVEIGVGEAEARELNAPYLKRVATGLPWVIVKWAQTLDGKIATATGDSKWISGEASRAVVHGLRARVDAVVTGIGTVLADDPSLTARHVEIKRTAKRVVVGDPAAIPRTARLLTDGGPEVIHYDAQSNLRPLLESLVRDHDATNVLVEAGGGLVGAFLDQGLVDQAIAFIAPKLVGDHDARGPVRGLACDQIAEARRLELRSVAQIGEDVMLDYRVLTHP